MADYGIEIDDAGLAGVIPGTTLAADPYSSHPTAGEAGAAQGTGTGQHGIVPILGGGTVGDTITAIWDWLNTPFNRPMSPVTIFAITGSIVIAIVLWNLILYHIRIAAEAI
jgi:hypothetical protein